MLAGGGDDLGRDDLAAVGADGLDAAVRPAGGGHGVLARAVAGVQARALAADLVALPCAVGFKRPVHGGVVVDGDDRGLKAVLRRAGGLDRRGCAVAAHVRERLAAGEGVVADARHGGGQLHLRQRGAALEAGIGDVGHAVGQRHLRQRDAAVEGGAAELRHGGGDACLGERLAAFECALADGGHLALIVGSQQLRAVGKALAGHGGDGSRQAHAAQTRAGVKRAAAEGLQPVGQRDGGEVVAGKTEVADVGHGFGQGDALELRAQTDAVAADARHALRQRDLLGGRQQEQRIVAHVRDAVLDDDLLEVALEIELWLEAGDADQPQRLVVPPRGEVALGEVEVGHFALAGDGQCFAAEQGVLHFPVQAVVLTEVTLGGLYRQTLEDGVKIQFRDLKLLLKLVDLFLNDLSDDLFFQIVDFAGRCVHGQAGEQPHDQNQTQRQREQAFFHSFFLLSVMLLCTTGILLC